MAYSTNSRRVFTGTDGATTNRFGGAPMSPTPTKSEVLNRVDEDSSGCVTVAGEPVRKV